MREGTAAGIAVLAAAVCLLLWQRHTSDTIALPAPAPQPRAAAAAPSPATRHAAATPACTAKAAPLVPQTPLRESKMRGDEVDKLFVLGYTQPERFLPRLAAPDDVTALAAFKLVRNCFRATAPWSPPPADPDAIASPSMTGCPALPAWLVHGAPAMLKAAADRGSPDAMLDYAMDTEARAPGFVRAEEPASAAAASALLREAESYGRQAAQHGLLDAYIFMSRAYETGQFGTRDIESAYAYALPLADHPEYGPYKDHLAELARHMTPAQLDSARTRAYGCAAAGAGDALRNPFG